MKKKKYLSDYPVYDEGPREPHEKKSVETIQKKDGKLTSSVPNPKTDAKKIDI